MRIAIGRKFRFCIVRKWNFSFAWKRGIYKRCYAYIGPFGMDWF